MTTDPPIVQRAERVKTWLRLFVLLALLVGVAALVAAPVFAGGEGLLLGTALAAGAWSGAAIAHFTWLATPRPDARTHRIDTATGTAFRLGLRPQLPLMMLSTALGLLLFFGIAGVWMGGPLWLVLCGIFALGGLYVLPDAIRALTMTGRKAVIDATGFTYNGYSYETRVAWDDIASVDVDDRNKNLPAMTFTLRPGRTLTWTRRRWVAHAEPPPKPDRFTIPALVFDQPWNVLSICDGMTKTPADHRAGYLANVGRTMLEDPAFPRSTCALRLTS